MQTVTPGPKRWWALVAIVLCTLTLGFDTTILNVGLPTLAAELDAGTSQLQWIVDAYVLVFAGLILPMGALGDRFGRKRLMLIGLALFAAASLAATYAGSAETVIAARALMGVGAAILTPLTGATLPVMFPPHERPKAIAMLTLGMGIGLPLGPIIGGYLLEHFWWGSIFLINVPVAAVALLAVATLIPESRSGNPKPVDVAGGVTSTAGLVLFVYGVIEAPGRGWTDPLVLATLAGGLLLLVAFAVVERRARQPMIDLRWLRRPRFAWGTATATLVSFSLFGLLFVLPLFLQAVRGHDALEVGVRLLPLIGGLFVGAPLAARLTTAVGTKIPVTFGLAVAAGGLLLGTQTGAGSGYGFLAAWMTITGFGIGLALSPSMDAVLGELPHDEAGSGTAVTMSLRQTAGALGVALLGSLLSAVYRSGLDGAPTAARESITGALAAAAGAGDAALAAAARAAFSGAMAAVLLVCAVLSAIGSVLAALLLPARPDGVSAAPGPAGAERAPSTEDARELADELSRSA
jgi:EmrB/QacA subfamily drug resistance transporter